MEADRLEINMAFSDIGTKIKSWKIVIFEISQWNHFRGTVFSLNCWITDTFLNKNYSEIIWIFTFLLTEWLQSSEST